MGLLDRARSVQKRSRARLLVGAVAILVAVAVFSVVLTGEILERRLDQRIDALLRQESKNLEQLASRPDPETGLPFGVRTQRIFDVYLDYSPPSRNEAFITFVDGAPTAFSPDTPPYRLDKDSALVARWGTVPETDRGGAQTPEGWIEYVAVPFKEGAEVRGVFVAAVFRDLAAKEVDESLWAAIGVAAGMLLAGSVLAWYLVRRIPLSVAPSPGTDRSVSDQERLDVLTATFDDALRRLESVPQEQRAPDTVADEDEASRARTAAVEGLDTAARTAEALSTLAQAEQRGFLVPQKFAAEDLVDDVIAQASALADRRWHLDARGGGSIVADRRRLSQALLHLVLNAVQHTKEDDEIGVGSVIEGGEVRFWVRDTGAGIPRKEQKHVFEELYRGSAAEASPGAGLGLTVADAVAKAHDGRVDLTGGPGLGTTVSIVLPQVFAPAIRG